MTAIYRTVGNPQPVAFHVDPAATATPVVVLYDDPAHTVPHLFGGYSEALYGSGPYGGSTSGITIVGAGTDWTFTLPVSLTAGTYYPVVTAQTAAGTVTDSSDRLVVTVASIDIDDRDAQVQAVADVIPRRATDGHGLAGGTFDDTTSPTGTQVARVFARYQADVAAALGGTVAPALASRAVSVAALGAAAQVELSFFPETADTVSKPLFDRYDRDLKSLIGESQVLVGSDAPGSPASPLGDFPSVPAGVDERYGLAGAGGFGPFPYGGPVDEAHTAGAWPSW